MNDDLGSHLFTFAVISDTHVNEAEERSASPYPSNRLANARFRHVVRALNQHDLAFTAHLGDMGNPLPELGTYEPAAESFKTLAAELRSPLYLAAGNHCVGDKPTGWVPVPRVSAESLARYRRLYGRHYYAFDRGPCRFVVLSSLVVNSGLRSEGDHRRWAEKTLAKAGDEAKRIWLLMHYPPYVAAPDEPGSYDNLDEPGRSWLLGLLERYEVEAVFSGHVHNYFYNRYAGTDLYTVPATSFVRQDYAELFPVAPEDREGGRNDLAKLGYSLVRVFGRGHHHRVVRTYGKTEPPNGPDREARDPAPAVLGEPAPPPAPDGSWGVEMRRNWLSRLALHTNNSVSPFTRRSARNDWAVLALQEMGISKVRLSLQELAVGDVGERMATLQDRGFEFLVYSHGAPGDREYRLIRENRSRLAGWELILYPHQVEPAARRISRICGRLPGSDPLPCYLNEVRDRSEITVDDANVKHEANYGFQTTDLEGRLEELHRRTPVRETFRGFVFRLWRRGEPRAAPWSAIRRISEHGRELGMRHQVHVLFSGSLTAERLVDDLGTASRVAEAALASALAGNVDLYFDTFEDADRGYFVRHGLVDARYNPRLAARVLGHLGAGLAGWDGSGIEGSWERDSARGRVLMAGSGGRFLALIAPRRRFTLRRLATGRLATASSGAGRLFRVLDLADGTVRRLRLEAARSGLELEEPLVVEAPLLLSPVASG